MTREERFQAIRDTVEELATLYGELTEITKAKRSAYHSAFLASTETSFTARDGFAKAAAHDLDMDELDIKCEVAIREMQLDILKFQIEHNAEDV